MPEWRASIEVNLYVTANYKAPRDDEQAWVKANGIAEFVGAELNEALVAIDIDGIEINDVVAELSDIDFQGSV